MTRHTFKTLAPRRLFVLATVVVLASLNTACAVIAVADLAASAVVGTAGLAVDAAVGTARIGGKVIGATANAITGGGSGE